MMNNRFFAKVLFSTVLLTVISWSAPQVTKAARNSLSDNTISGHVERELLFDLAVDSSQIKIETTNGVVKLSGDVNNLLAKQRSARIAKAVRGVRSVVNEILVHPDTPHTDLAILSNINSALRQNPATESYKILVKVEHGHATLTGIVDSWQEKNFAAKVASGIAGLREITNNLRVDIPKKRFDGEIANEIKQSFKWDIFIPTPNDIQVTCNDGQVELSGTIQNASAKHRAYVKSWVAGVSLVNHENLKVRPANKGDRLRSKPTPVLDDAEIAEAIKQANIYDPRVFAFNLEADVDFGVATLTGDVNNQDALRAAEQNARNTVGVVSVVNRLRVEQGKMTDKGIEKRVNDALLRHPYLEERQIIVNVDNGVVKLYGSVDTIYEKSEAEKKASQVRGTVLVENNLLVLNEEVPYTFDPYVDDFSLENYSWYEPIKSVTNKTDGSIREDIQSELFWSPFVDENQVKLKVEDGVATLTGKVNRWTERDAAEENALEGGAIKVINKLDIE